MQVLVWGNGVLVVTADTTRAALPQLVMTFVIDLEVPIFTVPNCSGGGCEKHMDGASALRFSFVKKGAFGWVFGGGFGIAV